MSIKILLSTTGTGLGDFSSQGTAYRKDYIRAGRWKLKKDGEVQELVVSKDRIKRWAETFKLMRQRGISVPLTVDHIQVRDPKTGKMLRRKLTPGMAEAKRGDIVALFEDAGVGFFDVVPSDEDAKTLMFRCPEVSLELQYNIMDGHGNTYDEAITAITLTPIPVIPGQDMEWEPVVATSVAASRHDVASARELICLSAEPLVSNTGDGVPTPKEKRMSPTLMSRLRAACAMPDAPEDEVHAKAVEHMERCAGGRYMSREDHDAALAAATKSDKDQIVALSRQLDEAKKGTRVLTVEELTRDVDPDALEMAATGYEARINALGNRVTPVQKKLLLSRLCGTPEKRDAICLSRKTATKVGLPGPLADEILKLFEAADPIEMQKLLTEQSKIQQKGNTLLSREEDGAPEHDPKVTQAMIDRINGQVERQSKFVM